MVSGPEMVVISVSNIGLSPTLVDDVVGRYVATSIAFESLSAYALARSKQILKERSPGINRGCLHDFHRMRETYVMQTQRPELCDEELRGIREIFGDSAVTEIRAIFKNISSDR